MTHTTNWKPPLEILNPKAIKSANDGDILLLPRSIDQDGLALYSDYSLDLIKRLKSENMSIEFGHPRSGRKYLSEYSSAILLTITLAVFGNFTYDCLKNIYKVVHARARQIGVEEDDAAVEVKIASITKTNRSTKIEGFSYKGPIGGLEPSITSILDTGKNGTSGDNQG